MTMPYSSASAGGSSAGAGIVIEHFRAGYSEAQTMAQAVSPRQFSLLDLDPLRPESPADPPWADPAGGFL